MGGACATIHSLQIRVAVVRVSCFGLRVSLLPKLTYAPWFYSLHSTEVREFELRREHVDPGY